MLINKTKRKPAEVSLINCRPVCLTSGVQLSLSPVFCHLFSVTCFLALLPIGRLDRQRLRGWRYCPQTGLSTEKGLQESGRKFDC